MAGDEGSRQLRGRVKQSLSCLNLTRNSSHSDYFLPLKLQVPCSLADGFYLLGDLGASKEGWKGPNGLCPELLFSPGISGQLQPRNTWPFEITTASM